MRLMLAFRAFFKVLFDASVARQVHEVLAQPEAREEAAGEVAPKPAEKKPARSEAITLLATLQREARLIDFLMEPLDGYADAQIGAAVRDVHRGSREVIGRIFALAPIESAEEGATVEVPAGFDSGRFQLTGNVTGEPPFQGSLVHHGWEASRCELPHWSGSPETTHVVAPVEVELK